MALGGSRKQYGAFLPGQLTDGFLQGCGGSDAPELTANDGKDVGVCPQSALWAMKWQDHLNRARHYAFENGMPRTAGYLCMARAASRGSFASTRPNDCQLCMHCVQTSVDAPTPSGPAWFCARSAIRSPRARRAVERVLPGGGLEHRAC